MFTHVLFVRNRDLDASDLDLHDGSESPFFDFWNLLYHLWLVAAVGDLDPDAYGTSPVNQTLLSIILFVIVVVMMNVLIAIVSDEYDRCTVRGGV